jgi:hemerythrin-like domain-containing protein
MRCTELVIQDHVILRRGLAVVDGMLNKLEAGQRIEIFDAATILKFLRVFGDHYHQVMEETVLFPTLLSAFPNETGLQELAAEHGDERMLVSQIEDSLMSRRGMAFLRSSRQLTTLLRNHCDREEAVLCGLGQCLSEEQDVALVAEFMKARVEAEMYTNFARLERRYVRPVLEQVEVVSEPVPQAMSQHR